MATESKWATRFVWVAIFQGALVSLLTLFLVLGEVGFLHPSVSLLINTTVPGIWIALGYFAYLIVGVVGMAVTALFYQYLEVNLKSPYTGGAKSLAWSHLILSNVGIIGTLAPNHLYRIHNWRSHASNSAGGLGMVMGDVEAMVSEAVPHSDCCLRSFDDPRNSAGRPWIRDRLQRETEGAILTS